MIEDLIPENAPFDEEQRAWLNGFLAGLLGLSAAPRGPAHEASDVPESDTDDFPWADPQLDLERRLMLAGGRPLELRLMAAMAQHECGQCGYSCRGYARALAQGSEQDSSLCFPGGRGTARSLKTMLAEAAAPARSGPAVVAAASPEVGAAPAAGAEAPASSAGSASPGAPSASSNAHVAPASMVVPRPRVSAESEGARARQDSGFPASGVLGSGPERERQLNPWRVKSVEKHTDTGTDPELCEIVLDRGGVPIAYRVGDCVAVGPQNDPDVVRLLLRALRARGQETISTPWGMREAWRCLLEDADVSHLRDETLELLARSAQTAREARDIARLLEGATAPNMDLLELLEAFPSSRPRLSDLVATLGAIQPRLYSIASSPSVHPNEVRLAVRAKGYERGGREQKGVASSFLAGRVFMGDSLPTHIQHTERFVLPNDDQTPLIMLGYGTGVARYRAFLEELDHRGRRGNTWLLLINRPETFEPLYDTEIKHWLRKGVLERLDAERVGAGRRASAHDLLRKRARVLGAWLERGAWLYVCGEALEVMTGLEEALVEIVARQLELSDGEAVAYVKAMRRERRYIVDVY
jgi:sulfite reductase (NADPH) flavoprotein alpha-component